MAAQIKAKQAKADQKTVQRGGRGSNITAAETEYHPHPAPGASAAVAQVTAADILTHDIIRRRRRSASYAAVNAPKQTSDHMLPTGLLPAEAKTRLNRLSCLYSELKATQACLTYIASLLPNHEAIKSLQASAKLLEAEIANLAKAGTCSPSSEKSHQQR